MTGYVLRNSRTLAYRSPAKKPVESLDEARFWRAKEDAEKEAESAGAVWRVHLVTYVAKGGRQVSADGRP
jgi:hypothetical protein